MVWAREVLAATKLRTPTQLAKELKLRAGKRLRQLPTRSVYYKYLRGEAGPSRAVVDEIEGVLPGTAKWYDHPLWALAKKQPDIFELGELVRRLPGSMLRACSKNPFNRAGIAPNQSGYTITRCCAQLIDSCAERMPADDGSLFHSC